MTDIHTPQGQKLDGFNLQAVLDSGTNAADLGRQQFFTPAAVAAALMTPMPRPRACFVDLTMGAGGLLLGADAKVNLGVDIDPRCARQPRGAKGDWRCATADVTSLYPLLAEVDWHYDLGAFNPPFSIRWHSERLAALADSHCDAVRATFARAKDTIDSTLATFLIALDRLTDQGEGYFICNEATAIRLFGHPDDPVYAAKDSLRSHVWAWLTVPPGMFENVRDFDVAVLYFARGHHGADPIHLTAASAAPEDIAAALEPLYYRRYSARRGLMVHREDEFNLKTVPYFLAATEELAARQRPDPSRQHNVWLSNGTIRRHLTPFQSFSGRIPKDDIKALNDIQGKTPAALVVAKATRLALLRAVRSPYWIVDPALVAAVDEAVAEYNATRAPFYPLNDVQRLGFLDEEDSILCKLSGQGFTAGQRYPITCQTEPTSRDLVRKNIHGRDESVTLSGNDLAIILTGDDKKQVIYRLAPADEAALKRDELDKREGRTVADLIERFEIPAVPDVAMVHPAKFAANLARIEEIESGLKGFKARGFQRDDLSRFCVHDGGVKSWDPGLGKTIAMFFAPQIKGARRTLIVAPEQLHQQIIDEGSQKFGVTVKRLGSQEDFENDAALQTVMRDYRMGRESEINGWWITSYTSLGYNGGDEWEGNTTAVDRVNEKLVTPRLIELRQMHPGYAKGCDEHVGVTRSGVTCLWRPTLATLVADLFDCVECDEAVRLKSNESYTSLGVRKMRPKFRFVMTATPIKNHLDDIFWLCWWAAGGTAEANARWPYAGTNEAREEFANTFMVRERNHTKEEEMWQRTRKSRKIERRTAQICNLHLLWKVLSGVVIRRRKDSCGEDIVPKTFIPITVKPGKAQLAAYQFHVNHPPQLNRNGEPVDPIARVVMQLTNLRQAALCPDSENLTTARISLHKMRSWLKEQARVSIQSPGPVDAARTRKAALVAYKGQRTPFEAEAEVAFEIVERMIRDGGIDLSEVFEAAPKLADKLRALVEVDGKEATARSWTDHNPKQAAILSLICELTSQGEQSMVLTPFQDFNATLYRRLVSAGVSVCLLDGTVSPAKRGAMAKDYKRRKYAVLIGGEQAMGEGGSFENCSHLIRPSLGWAMDINRQCEDRPHRLTSPKPVQIYEFQMEHSIDQRLASVYHEKGDSSQLALDGRLFAEATDEINLGQLLADAIRNFDPDADTIDEADIEKEWHESMKGKLTNAERAFRQFHPAIVADRDGEKVTPQEVRDAVRAVGSCISPVVGIVRCVPSATFAALIDCRDSAVVEQVRADFVAYCNETNARDWRKAWNAFDRERIAARSKPVPPKALSTPSPENAGRVPRSAAWAYLENL